jgi:hypothetical protein
VEEDALFVVFSQGKQLATSSDLKPNDVVDYSDSTMLPRSAMAMFSPAALC